MHTQSVLKRAAIFLDRDGTLNEDIGYLHTCEAWRWLPGAVEALAMFTQQGYALIVITNQSGIARGYYDEDAVHTLHSWVNADLAKQNLHIDAFYHCPHHPQFSGICPCRKPSAHLLLQAAQEWNIDLESSFMIGDKMSDVDAGHAAGCISYLIGHSADVKAPHGFCVPSLLDAAKHICLSHK